jgi:hypothetical protein
MHLTESIERFAGLSCARMTIRLRDGAVSEPFGLADDAPHEAEAREHRSLPLLMSIDDP